MTERFGALTQIVLKSNAGRERASDAFTRRYAMEPLLLDKWFALNAQIPERETLDRVRALMNHRGFSMSNPNRVRALIGGFTANHTQFNRVDGAGFAFLEEIVVALDPTNPQIAARLLTAMRSWRSLERTRRGLAEAMLNSDRRAAGIVARRARHRYAQPGLERCGPVADVLSTRATAGGRHSHLIRKFVPTTVKGLDKDSHKDSYRSDSGQTAALTDLGKVRERR